MFTVTGYGFQTSMGAFLQPGFCKSRVLDLCYHSEKCKEKSRLLTHLSQSVRV